MANSYVKAEKIAATALGLLQREIVLPRLVWMDATQASDWQGNQGDTVTIRVPARTTARTRQLRGARPSASEGDGIITMDDLTETSIDVTLDQAIYSAVPTTDEEETLDIVSYGQQILAPMVRAVAEGAENKIAKVMANAPYVTNIGINNGNNVVFDAMVDARRALNDAHVPMNDRIVVVGSEMEAAFLKDDHLNHADTAGDNSALRDANIGHIAGFGNVIVSQAIDPDVGYAFHRTAFSAVMVAPKIPQGASFGARQALAGVGMRWIKDYDFRNAQDRSMVDVYMGCSAIIDGPESNETQTVTISGSPTGGAFKLTYNGYTTADIAYNAAASAVKSALVAATPLSTNDLTVSGSAGGPYTVEFDTGSNVPAMTVSNTLTGGTTPSAAVATTSQGGQAPKTFVRAVKLHLTHSDGS